MITCQYCKYFYESKIVDSENKIRECKKTFNKVSAISEACKMFDATECFYCFASSQRLYIKACISRQDKASTNKLSSYHGCKNCSQGQLIKTMVAISPKKSKIKRYNFDKSNKISKIKRFVFKD